MSARMDTIRRMAEHDPYWRGVRDALEDRYGFTSAPQSNEPTAGEWREYARLMQARINNTLSRPEVRDALQARLER